MTVQPFISWSRITLLGVAPSALALLVAQAVPLPGITLGALAVLPINLLAVALGALALGLAITSNLGPALAFTGIVAGLLVRVAGTLLAAVAIHAVQPEQLTAALATLCALLLAALGGESLLYARRLLAPSSITDSPESARA